MLSIHEHLESGLCPNNIQQLDAVIRAEGINAPKDKYGRTLLMVALEDQNVETQTVDYLLSRGADVNVTDRNGRTVLDRLEERMTGLIHVAEANCAAMPWVKNPLRQLILKMIALDASNKQYGNLAKVLRHTPQMKRQDNERAYAA